MNIIERIYKLKESSILTPESLVSNIKISNFSSISFTNEMEGIKGTLVCEEGNSRTIYNYFFDLQDKLQLVVALENDEMTELFNRKKELDILLNRYESSVENTATAV